MFGVGVAVSLSHQFKMSTAAGGAVCLHWQEKAHCTSGVAENVFVGGMPVSRMAVLNLPVGFHGRVVAYATTGPIALFLPKRRCIRKHVGSEGRRLAVQDRGTQAIDRGRSGHPAT